VSNPRRPMVDVDMGMGRRRGYETPSKFGPQARCQRTACAAGPEHLGGAHIDPRSPLYDGPDSTVRALNLLPRRAAEALFAAGAPIPEVVELVEEIHRLGMEVAAARNDGDRREAVALATAGDCSTHGEEIRRLEDRLAQFDHGEYQAEAARRVLVEGLSEIHAFADQIDMRAKAKLDVPGSAAMAARLLKFVDKVHASHQRAWHGKARPSKRAPKPPTPPKVVADQADLFDLAGGDSRAYPAESGEAP
jgi:hypothetical protein